MVGRRKGGERWWGGERMGKEERQHKQTKVVVVCFLFVLFVLFPLDELAKEKNQTSRGLIEDVNKSRVVALKSNLA